MNPAALARLQILAAAALFSTGGAAIKGTELTSWQVAAFRSGVAALTVLALVPAARRGWNWRAAGVGIAYAAMMTLFVTANKLTTAANTIFLQSAAPLYILAAGPWLLGEKARRSDLATIGVMALGFALVFSGNPPPAATAPSPALGNALASVSGVACAAAVMGLRWLSRGAAPGENPGIPAVVIGNLICFAAALPMALPVEAARPADAAAILYLGIFQIGIAYIFLTKGIRRVGALEVSLLLLLEPALNPIWAWYFHGERPGSGAVAGGALILGATGVMSWIDSRRAQSPSAKTEGAP